MATPEYIYDIDDSPTEMQNEMSDLIKQMAAQKKATQDFELGLMRDDIVRKENRAESDRLYERGRADAMENREYQSGLVREQRGYAEEVKREARDYSLQMEQRKEIRILTERLLILGKTPAEVDAILNLQAAGPLVGPSLVEPGLAPPDPYGADDPSFIPPTAAQPDLGEDPLTGARSNNFPAPVLPPAPGGSIPMSAADPPQPLPGAGDSVPQAGGAPAAPADDHGTKAARLSAAISMAIEANKDKAVIEANINAIKLSISKRGVKPIAKEPGQSDEDYYLALEASMADVLIKVAEKEASASITGTAKKAHGQAFLHEGNDLNNRKLESHELFAKLNDKEQADAVANTKDKSDEVTRYQFEIDLESMPESAKGDLTVAKLESMSVGQAKLTMQRAWSNWSHSNLIAEEISATNALDDLAEGNPHLAPVAANIVLFNNVDKLPLPATLKTLVKKAKTPQEKKDAYSLVREALKSQPEKARSFQDAIGRIQQKELENAELAAKAAGPTAAAQLKSVLDGVVYRRYEEAHADLRKFNAQDARYYGPGTPNRQFLGRSIPAGSGASVPKAGGDSQHNANNLPTPDVSSGYHLPPDEKPELPSDDVKPGSIPTTPNEEATLKLNQQNAPFRLAETKLHNDAFVRNEMLPLMERAGVTWDEIRAANPTLRLPDDPTDYNGWVTALGNPQRASAKMQSLVDGLAGRDAGWRSEFTAKPYTAEEEAALRERVRLADAAKQSELIKPYEQGPEDLPKLPPLLAPQPIDMPPPPIVAPPTGAVSLPQAPAVPSAPTPTNSIPAQSSVPVPPAPASIGRTGRYTWGGKPVFITDDGKGELMVQVGTFPAQPMTLDDFNTYMNSGSLRSVSGSVPEAPRIPKPTSLPSVPVRPVTGSSAGAGFRREYDEKSKTWVNLPVTAPTPASGGWTWSGGEEGNVPVVITEEAGGGYLMTHPTMGKIPLNEDVFNKYLLKGLLTKSGSGGISGVPTPPPSFRNSSTNSLPIAPPVPK